MLAAGTAGELGSAGGPVHHPRPGGQAAADARRHAGCRGREHPPGDRRSAGDGHRLRPGDARAHGRIDRIDLIVEEGAAGRRQLERARAVLPPGVQILPAGRTRTTEEMTRAFRLNLTALSMLALVCGAFLIYNTMTFSVVQRRQWIGTLRALGVSRREIFTLVLGEAAAVAVLGTAVGLGAGVLLGRGLVRLVTQTINDLYFVVSVRELAIPPATLAVGALPRDRGDAPGGAGAGDRGHPGAAAGGAPPLDAGGAAARLAAARHRLGDRPARCRGRSAGAAQSSR